MRNTRLAGIALLVLGAGMAVAATAGPLVFGAIRFHVSASAENQLLGGDWVTLCLVAPLALLAGALWLRGHPLAPALAFGPALYAVYTCITLVLGADYTRYPGNSEDAFPLYWLLIVLGWAIVLAAWRALDVRPLPAPSHRLRRWLGGLFVAANLVFALAWLQGIAGVVRGGAPPAGYADDPSLFWLIRLLDLAFVIPAGLLTGAGLWRGAGWALRPTYALAGFLTPFVASIAGMAIVMAVRDDPAADPVLLVASAIVAAGLALATGFLYRPMLSRGATSATPRRTEAPRPTPLRSLHRQR